MLYNPIDKLAFRLWFLFFFFSEASFERLQITGSRPDPVQAKVFIMFHVLNRIYNHFGGCCSSNSRLLDTAHAKKMSEDSDSD